MNIIENLLTNVVFLMFPLFIYIIYLTYQNNADKKENVLALNITSIASIYLLMKYNDFNSNYISLIVLCNIPLLISYLKDQKSNIFLISIFLVVYNIFVIGLNFYLVIFEYLLYYFLYKYIVKNEITKDFLIKSFTLIKTFFFSLFSMLLFPKDMTIIEQFLIIGIIMITFYFITIIIIYLLDRAEEIINLNRTLKELEKEKTLRNSLFKITHEIKNPIAVCKGYLDILDLNDKKKIDKYIPIVKNEISRTLVLMDDFLDYTKITVEKDYVDINSLIEETVEQLRSLYLASGVKVITEFIDDEIIIFGDYNRLKQVLINILKNAIEAKKDNKELNLKIKTLVKNDMFVVHIIDDGIGISKKDLFKITDMFFTTKSKGTGLGLALSKEIIDFHNGSLKYESQEDKGTKAIISLPIEKDFKK